MAGSIEISRSLQEKIDSLSEIAENQVAEKLLEVSKTLIKYSPVDTGAFVTSWSLGTSPTAMRYESSKGRASSPWPAKTRGDALGNMVYDIGRLKKRFSFRRQLGTSAGTFYFVNGSPHAVPVDKNHAVIARARRIHG